MLKPSLQLKLGQQLTMTPQLQQAIRLLQLPALELQAHIRELLETNVMLEPMEESEATGTFEAVVTAAEQPKAKEPESTVEVLEGWDAQGAGPAETAWNGVAPTNPSCASLRATTIVAASAGRRKLNSGGRSGWAETPPSRLLGLPVWATNPSITRWNTVPL